MTMPGVISPRKAGELTRTMMTAPADGDRGTTMMMMTGRVVDARATMTMMTIVPVGGDDHREGEGAEVMVQQPRD